MEQYNSKPSDQNGWFSASITYQGRGRVEFDDPQGSVEGEITILCDESGRFEIEMIVDPTSIQANPPLKTGLLEELLSGSKTQDKDGAIYFGIAAKMNTCTSLQVNLTNGVINAIGEVILRRTLNNRAKIGFWLSEFHFTPHGSREPKYWSIPLSNFLSSFTITYKSFEQLKGHPLLLNSNGSVIEFLYKDKFAYIEPLLDYEERKEKLETGFSKQLFTALMVGEGVGGIQDYTDVSTWLSTDVLVLLGVAVGTEVGTNRIELFSEDGELVKRIHVNLGTHDFHKGHVAIRQNVDDGGIGYFLTKAQSMPAYGSSYLRVASRYLIQSGYYHQAIETQLVHLFRAFDGLCKYYNVDTISLSASLSPSEKTNIQNILNNTKMQIENIANSYKVSGDYDTAGKIDAIARRTGGMMDKDKPFGLSVVELLKIFNLYDSDVASNHFKSNPRADKIDLWSSILAHYRGIVIHEGHFDFLGGKYNIHDVMVVRNHLHDILLRIILQLLGYEGTYQPTVIHLATKQKIDWVQPVISGTRLGYK
jgi:hypothetical protein